MAGKSDALLSMDDLPEISAFFGLVPPESQKQTWVLTDGTGVTVFPDMAHCLMLDPFWEDVAERTLEVVQKWEGKQETKQDLKQSLTKSLNKE
jgi:hypothetical protein